MSRFGLAVVLASAMLLDSAANAATVGFDFTGTTGEAASLSFTEGGVNVTATGGGLPLPGPALVTGNAGGLGVVASSGGFSSDFNRELNSVGGGFSAYSNFIELSFDREVTFLSLDFESFGLFDNVVFSVDGNAIGGASVDPYQLSDEFSRDQLTGQSFLVRSSSSGFIPAQSSFLLAGAVVEVGETAVIPLPAGLPLYAAALITLALATRRRCRPS